MIPISDLIFVTLSLGTVDVVIWEIKESNISW